MSQALTASALPRSLPALKEAALKFARQNKRFESMSAANEARAENLIDTVLVVGTAGAMSYANGKQFQAKGTTYQVGGYEADLLGGAVIAGASVLFPSVLGKYSEKAGKIGTGLLSAYVVRMAFGKGQAAQAAHPAAAAPPVQMAPPNTPAAATGGVAPAGNYYQGR